jgi:hypothetical protein
MASAKSSTSLIKKSWSRISARLSRGYLSYYWILLIPLNDH